MHLDARSKQSANTAVLAQLCTWGHFKGFKDPNSGISLLTTEGRSRGAVMDEGLLLCWFFIILGHAPHAECWSI